MNISDMDISYNVRYLDFIIKSHILNKQFRYIRYVRSYNIHITISFIIIYYK